MFNPLALFATFKTAIIVGALAATIGFTSGYVTKGRLMVASEVKELRADIKQTAVNVIETSKQSVVIERKVVASNTAGTSIQAVAKKRLVKQKERKDEIETVAGTPAPQCPAFVLDVGTVRLLNAAREGLSVDSAGGSDEALDAPSSIGVDKLVDNDLAVVKQYNELAIRHDSLVDVVEKKLKEQAQ